MSAKDTRSRVAKWWGALNLDRADALVAVGLGLVACGLWETWRPGAFVVPGLVLIFYALPSRPPFIEREQKGRR